MSKTKKRRSASENPFYIMATIYGENTDEVDFDLSDQNRDVWNAWVCQGLPKDEKDDLQKTYPELMTYPGLIIPDWTEGLQKTVNDAFAKRLPGGPIPDHNSHIDFKDTDFEHPVNFNGFLFLKEANFKNAQFKKDARFAFAVFLSFADFLETKFTQDTAFLRARFTDHVDFSFSEFVGSAQFSNVEITGIVNFVSSRFKAQSYFEAAIFKQSVNFTDVSFDQPANFRGARFVKYYPYLYGKDLHGKTTLTAKANHWPKVAEYSQNHEVLEYAASSCAHLRHNMTVQGLPDEAHFFFRREMDLRLKLNQGLKKLPYWLFGVLSEYGYSYTRPLGWLIQLWLVWTLVYTPYFLSKAGVETLATKTAALAKAAGLSFANIFVFFGFHKRFDMKWSGDSNWLIAFTGLETILGFILLFFLGLGLRNQFRLK